MVSSPPPPPPPHTHTQTYWVSLVNGLFTLLAMFHLAYLGLMFGGQSEKETSLGIQVAPMITASAHSQPSNLGFELLGMSYNKSTLVCSTACNSPFPPTHTHSHTHTHTQSHTHTQTHIHTQSHTHTITYTHTHNHTHTHTHMYTQGYSMMHTLRKWSHLDFLSHWIVLLTYLISMVI